MTRAWPRVHGLMSMNEIVCSSSSTFCTGSSPATILQKMQSSSAMRRGKLLEPADTLEVAVEGEADGRHHQKRGGIAELPLQLRHVLEVHAVDPRDHRRHREDRDPRG